MATKGEKRGGRVPVFLVVEVAEKRERPLQVLEGRGGGGVVVENMKATVALGLHGSYTALIAHHRCKKAFLCIAIVTTLAKP